jgi:C4-dicarboxylate transporter DctM subunit
LTVTGVASSASSALINLVGDNKLAFLLIVNIILLIAGMFIDANSAMYIILPILYPVAMTLGVNPIHLGAVMVLNMAIGLVTPPVGINLYTGCGIAHISLKDISKAVIPFVLASIVVLLIVTYVPILSTWLPSLITE